MRISVTPSLIKKGTRANPFCCPTALAAKRLFPKAESIFVSGFGYIEVVIPGLPAKAVYQMPNKALKWIEGFDNGKKMKPISFTIKKRKAA